MFFLKFFSDFASSKINETYKINLFNIKILKKSGNSNDNWIDLPLQ